MRWICGLALALATAAVAQSPPQWVDPKGFAQVIERVAPVYPALARRQEITGRVVVWIYVNAEGNLTRARIRVSPHELLSDAVEAAVAKWKFLPAMKDGKPVASVGEYEFSFNLHDADVPLASDVPAPDAATVSRYIGSMEGAEEFRTKYWKNDRHKAFAASESGSWGWAGGRSSTEQAVQAALESCEKYRDRMTSACRIVDIDGQWQASAQRSTSKLHDLSPFEMTLYPREKVEAWPAATKEKALPLLDQCRSASESFVQVWRQQDADAIYAAVAQQMRDLYPRPEFDQSLAAMKKLAGVPTHVAFNVQHLVTRKGDAELRLDLASVVTYSVTTTAKIPNLVLMVTLAPEAGMCRVTGFQYFGTMPQWMEDSAQQPERGT